MDEQERKELAFLICLRKIRKNNISQMYHTLSPAEFYTLLAIQQIQGGSDPPPQAVRMSALIETMGMSPQATSKMLRTLEQKGYCRRITDPRNRRSTLIEVTQEGMELAQSTKEQMTRFARMVTQRMGDADMEEFIRLVNRCDAIMQEVALELYREKEELS